jgi:hypothetical protein
MPYQKTNWIDDETPFSATNMNKIEAGIANNTGLASYLAFCGNVNANMIDAALGKNNENLVTNLGMQLAMYAWFKGDSKVTYPFTNLITCDTLADCFNNSSAYAEMIANANVKALIYGSEYAFTKLLSIKAGTSLPSSYTTILASQTYCNAICSSSTAFALAMDNVTFWTSFIASSTARTSMYDNYTITEPVLANISAPSLAVITGSSQYASFSGNVGATTTTIYGNKALVLSISGNSYGITNTYSTFRSAPTSISISTDTTQTPRRFVSSFTLTRGTSLSYPYACGYLKI